MEAEEKDMLDLERGELGHLINKGLAFEVDVTVMERVRGIRGWLGKRVRRTEKRRYVMKQPTLTVLDLIAAEQVEMAIDEAVMQSENGLSEAKALAHKHSRRMARVLALAVMGQDYIIPIPRGSRMEYRYDDWALEQLTDVLFHSIRPSDLLEYAIMVTTMSNLGDFTNSIRLMSAARTTMPTLIEEDKQA